MVSGNTCDTTLGILAIILPKRQKGYLKKNKNNNTIFSSIAVILAILVNLFS